jgi:hypothetical protein
MFSKAFSSSISLATVTPSLVMIGAPYDFERTTFRPRGPRVTLTTLASVSMPRRIAARALVSNRMSLDMDARFYFAGRRAMPAGEFLHAGKESIISEALDLGLGEQ